MPSAKAKPAPPSPKTNRRGKSQLEIRDKKRKLRDDKSPSRSPDRRGKIADAAPSRKVKAPIPDRKHTNNTDKQDKQDKQSKLDKQDKQNKLEKQEANKPNSDKDKESREETNKSKSLINDKNKRILNKLLEDKKFKRPHSSGSQKIIERGKTDIKPESTTKTKSQRAICVNTVKHWYSPLDSKEALAASNAKKLDKEETSSSENKNRKDENPKRSALKLLLRRRLWQMSKSAIKQNAYWRELMEANRIDVDKVNIDAVDLSLIDIDALGIENKLLKKTVTWFLK